MQATAQRLAKMGVPIEEYPQTLPNLTAATANLFDLLQDRRLVLYPSDSMRLAASRAVIVESARGWRLDKLKQAHKIDVIVALSMACLAAVQGAGEYTYDKLFQGWNEDLDAKPQPPQPEQPQLSAQRIYGGEWWRLQPRSQPSTSADDRLREGYRALDCALRYGRGL
jgi:hypothetical protein